MNCIVKAVLDQRKGAHQTISVSHLFFCLEYIFASCYLRFSQFQHVVLVGGFAASDWLFNKVHDALSPLGLNILRPENHVYVFLLIYLDLQVRLDSSRNKAVSDGAISFYLDHFVRTRVSKLTYGDFCHIPYDPNDPSHVARNTNTFMSISGSKRISDYFDVILPIVTFFIMMDLS